LSFFMRQAEPTAVTTCDWLLVFFSSAVIFCTRIKLYLGATEVTVESTQTQKKGLDMLSFVIIWAIWFPWEDYSCFRM
jgi:hypothetical protein